MECAVGGSCTRAETSLLLSGTKSHGFLHSLTIGAPATLTFVEQQLHMLGSCSAGVTAQVSCQLGDVGPQSHPLDPLRGRPFLPAISYRTFPGLSCLTLRLLQPYYGSQPLQQMHTPMLLRLRFCNILQDLPCPQLPEDVTKAFDVAYANIKAFHEAQRSKDVSVETMPGVTCGRVTRPINAVGLYVPGGTAVLPSSALMLAVPAQIAGTERHTLSHVCMLPCSIIVQVVSTCCVVHHPCICRSADQHPGKCQPSIHSTTACTIGPEPQCLPTGHKQQRPVKLCLPQ